MRNKVKEIYIKLRRIEAEKHPKLTVEWIFRRRFKRKINWENPKDLNEKINWLKFHVDQKEWAKLADKYLVRAYVKERGLERILIPLLGHWDNIDDALADIKDYKQECVIKSNNGCGNIKIINEKSKVNISRELLQKWMDEDDYGVINAELHYQLIDNCIIAEEKIPNSNQEFSKSLIDYKIWCFDGKPFGCLVVYDRDPVDHIYKLDYYDLNWNQHPEYLTEKVEHKPLSRPNNWEEMIEIARILSEGHPQVRVDLYNVDGKIYFGELTFTSYAGFMTYFTQEHLRTMGDQITLNLGQKPNEFFK